MSVLGTWIYTCIYIFVYIHVCIWPSKLHTGHLEFVRVSCMPDVKFLGIYFQPSFTGASESTRPCGFIHPAMLQSSQHPEQEQLWPMQACSQGRLMAGESGQTGLPSHEPDCLPLVLITSFCKGSWGRKLAISRNGSRQDTSSLKSCQLTLAPVLLSRPLFNQGWRSIRAGTQLCR